MIECQVDYIMQVIAELLRRKAKTVQISDIAQEQFLKYVGKEMPKTVWGSSSCGSWYANDRGEITALWPGTCASYWLHTRKVRFEDFEFR